MIKTFSALNFFYSSWENTLITLDVVLLFCLSDDLDIIILLSAYLNKGIARTDALKQHKENRTTLFCIHNS